MSRIGKAVRSSSTVTTFSKPSLEGGQGNSAGQFQGGYVSKGRGTNPVLSKQSSWSQTGKSQ